MTATEIEKYIASARWQFAKSMPEIPHEYIMIEWAPNQSDQFMKFTAHIRSAGYDDFFFKKKYRYFNFGEYKYWTMDEILAETNLINRALIKNPVSESAL